MWYIVFNARTPAIAIAVLPKNHEEIINYLPITVVISTARVRTRTPEYTPDTLVAIIILHLRDFTCHVKSIILYILCALRPPPRAAAEAVFFSLGRRRWENLRTTVITVHAGELPLVPPPAVVAAVALYAPRRQPVKTTVVARSAAAAAASLKIIYYTARRRWVTGITYYL